MIAKKLRLGLITAAFATTASGGIVFAQPTDTPPPPPPDQPTEGAPAEPAPPPADETPPPADETPAPEATPAPDATPAPADEATSTTDENGEVIVITGSMIARKQTTTVAPLAIVDKVEIDAAGMASIGEILQNLPAQSNAINVQFNNAGDGSTRIDLRGLGSARTLVLVNGRRHVYGGIGANESVDLNAIPVAIIDRVEVLKDGASAIYGSDAIGGVVNIITRQDYEGTDASIYTGASGHGDGFVYDLSAVHGWKSDSGSFLFSAGYFDQQDVMAGDRAFAKADKDYDFACVQTEKDMGIPDSEIFGVYHPVNNPNGCIFGAGSIRTPEGVIGDLGEDSSPQWDAVNASDPDCAMNVGYWVIDPSNPVGARCLNYLGNSDDGGGDLYNFQPENYLFTPQKRYNLYAQGRWHLAKQNRIDGFFETSYMKRKSNQKLAPEPLVTPDEEIIVSADNIYNPFNRDFADIERRLVEFGNRIFFQDIDTFRIVTGLDGDINKDWHWQAHYNFGRTNAVSLKQGLLRRSKVAASLGPSFIDADGVPTCGTAAAPIDGCVPLNVFGGPGTITPDMVESLTYTGIAQGYTMQNVGQVTANGKLLDLGGGGDIRAAVGAEFRRVRGAYQPDPLTAAGDTTGNKEEPTGGYYDVFEGFAEVSAVPFVGKPFAEWLEINGAVRGYNYNTFGSGATFKGGALWRHPVGVAVRGTIGNAFRAPSIADLYAGVADDFPPVTDPCDTSMSPRSASAQEQCSAEGVPDNYVDPRTQLRSRVGGNPDAEPEKANIITAGTVYTPKQLEGLALTLDFFWLHITNAIQPEGAGTILSNCYNTSAHTDCDKIERNQNHQISVINDTVTNVGGTKTSGIDFQVRYDWKHLQAGNFRFNLEGTYLMKYNLYLPDGRVVEGKGNYDLGVYPPLKFNFGTVWAKKEFGAGVNMRFIQGFTECQDEDCDTYLDPGNPSYDPTLQRDVSANFTSDLFVSYALKSAGGLSQLTLGVNNVLDTDPPFIYGGFYGDSDGATYDFMGRFFYARFSQSY